MKKKQKIHTEYSPASVVAPNTKIWPRITQSILMVRIPLSDVIDPGGDSVSRTAFEFLMSEKHSRNSFKPNPRKTKL